MTYRSGWLDGESVPLAIRTAIIQTAEHAGALAGVSIPDNVSSIRLPELSVQFRDAPKEGGHLPQEVRELLAPWRRTRW
ncbi:hypothetical protein BOO71_0002350 [Deinococcus marmoris]|uniref:Uncharacterized protein n=1 Tax=Deinococcus marmoris TaxID=249408 RepID=A0A1U7P2Y1_9DEIO|nr:hypothetical protein BOO71_0002350 [Deinococcus marmoris]